MLWATLFNLFSFAKYFSFAPVGASGCYFASKSVLKLVLKLVLGRDWPFEHPLLNQMAGGWRLGSRCLPLDSQNRFCENCFFLCPEIVVA